MVLRFQPWTLIVARAIQGAGAALILPTSLALIAHASEDDDKTRTDLVGWWSASSALSVAAGPVVGGLLISWLGWRPIFLLNLAFMRPWASTCTRVLETSAKADGRFDIAGLVLAAVCLLIFTGSIIEAAGSDGPNPMCSRDLQPHSQSESHFSNSRRQFATRCCNSIWWRRRHCSFRFSRRGRSGKHRKRRYSDLPVVFAALATRCHGDLVGT
ncbi:MFS transporter [Bradyrhizobium pachyrhizi]|uniref:MFS transporter n=1 Tax=Bradyrhizobium pachyrhizi TaxID=280333 RepID=UPI003D36BEE1